MSGATSPRHGRLRRQPRKRHVVALVFAPVVVGTVVSAIVTLTNPSGHAHALGWDLISRPKSTLVRCLGARRSWPWRPHSTQTTPAQRIGQIRRAQLMSPLARAHDTIRT